MMWYALGIVAVILVVFTYGCCRMAGDYDAQMEKWEKTLFERECE